MSYPLSNYDYYELTKSYMGIFYSRTFSEFLNTTQTGAAHYSSGMEFSILVKSVFTSLCFCTIQFTLFCFLRPILKSLYQPRCFCVPNNVRMEMLPPGLLAWILPIFRYNISYYLSLGLDAYFFVRFIHILLLYFICIGSLNILVLVPLNLTGNANGYMTESGLDKLSLSNIAPPKINRLNSHCIMSLITIGLFHWLIIYELQSFIKIRQSHLLLKKHNSLISTNTILLRNVQPCLRDIDIINDMFSQISPCVIKNVWFLYDFNGINDDIEELSNTLNLLEMEEISYIKKELQIQPHRLQNRNSRQDIIKDIMFHPPIYLTQFRIPLLDRRIKIIAPGYIRYLWLADKVKQREWCISKINDKLKSIDNWKLLLSQNKIRKHSKVFIQFQSNIGSLIVQQCLLSKIQGNLDRSWSEMNADDILWNNLIRDNTVGYLIERYFVSTVLVVIIILYVVPVSFIGLFSHIPWLIRLMPFLRWIIYLPENIRETISSLLPSILLAILTEIVLVTFRFLIYFKGKITGCDLEIDLQRWYFAFLFVQQFLVVTILSSIIVVFKQIIDQPTSIPILLATNLPKAATFFFQYIAIKGLTFCGNSFLRIDQLILRYTIHRLKDRTPRQIFRRVTTLLKIRWGSVYPVFSVYASIGIAYCIISPIISVFVIFILSLSLLYYKYALRYVYSHINESETNGRLYPVALLHMYSGIYCLECCLIGILFLLKNESGKSPLKFQGWIMILVLLLTVFGHITLYNRYSMHFSLLPILDDKKYQDENLFQEAKLREFNRMIGCEGNQDHATHEVEVDEFYLNLKLHWLHPSFRFENPKIWLPDDFHGLSEARIKSLEDEIEGLTGGTTRGATIEVGRFSAKIMVFEAPPDFK